MGDADNPPKSRHSHGSKEMAHPVINAPAESIEGKEKKIVWTQQKTKESLPVTTKPKKPTFVFFSVTHVVDGMSTDGLLNINFAERSIKLYIDGILCRRINFPTVGSVSVKNKTNINLHLAEETIHLIVHKNDASLIHNILFHISIQRVELIPFDKISKYQTVIDVVNEKKKSFFSKSSLWKVRTPKWILVYSDSPFPHLKPNKDKRPQKQIEKENPKMKRSDSDKQKLGEKKATTLRKSQSAKAGIVESEEHHSDDKKRKHHQHKKKEEKIVVEHKTKRKEDAHQKGKDECEKVTERKSTVTHSKDSKEKKEHHIHKEDDSKAKDNDFVDLGLRIPSFPLPLFIIPADSEVEANPPKVKAKTDHHEKKHDEKQTKGSHRAKEEKEKSHKSKEDKEWHVGLLSTLLPHAVALSREAGLCPRECAKHFRVLCRLLRAVDPKPYVTIEGKKRYQQRQDISSSSSLSGPSETDTRTVELTSTERRVHFAAEEEYEAGIKEVERHERKTMKCFKEIVKKENPKNEYEFLKSIGKGGYGSVYTASRISDGVRVAVKVMHHDKDDLITVATEIVILEKMKHENILGYIDSYHYHGKTTLITEYLDGGSLKDHLSAPFNESDIAYVLSSVLKGLNFMHKSGFIHRDIKSANIMFTLDSKVKIIDLGLAVPQHPRPESRAGSKPYMAPEVILMRPYGTACDVWSVGCVAQEMSELLPPYREFTMLRLLFRTATVGAQGLRKVWIVSRKP